MYDVIVVGAGPAGCTASKVLAEKGYKVLLVEKFNTDDKGKEYHFEQEGLNVWRSHFDGWFAKKAEHYFYAYLQPELSEYDAWFNVKDDLLVESGYCVASAIMEHFDNPQVACEAYRQSTENLKSYMQCQWSLVGGMAGTFREME